MLPSRYHFPNALSHTGIQQFIVDQHYLMELSSLLNCKGEVCVKGGLDVLAFLFVNSKQSLFTPDNPSPDRDDPESRCGLLSIFRRGDAECHQGDALSSSLHFFVSPHPLPGGRVVCTEDQDISALQNLQQLEERK